MELIEAINALEEAGKNFVLEKEILPTSCASGRFLGNDIFCVKSLPAFDNSAMDGFAFNNNYAELKVVGKVLAGEHFDKALSAGECVKIMTGAKIPDGANCVIPFEEVENGFDAVNITLDRAYKEYQNTRKKGEELSEGDQIFKAGDELDSSSLTVLASQGISNISVYRKLKVCVFSGGDELKEPWEIASENQIYNSNTTMIIENLKEAGIDCSYGGVMSDNKEGIIKSISGDYDVIFTTGGASKGEADFMREILKENGEFIVDFINIKPGKPIMVSKFKNGDKSKFIVALPGNPLAACVLLKFLIIPFLRQLSGARSHYLEYISVANIEPFSKKQRVEAMLGKLENGGFSITRGYTSGEIMAVVKSNAIAIFSMDICDIKDTDTIKVLPFKSMWSVTKKDYLN